MRESLVSSLGDPRGVGEAPPLPGTAEVSRLANGLTVCRLCNPQAPLVTTALFYRAGSRDEPAGQSGIAHFLEHMMFKGSALYASGEIDRRTLALGGANNAFTGHDLTAYYFNFAADRWQEALAIEADRMAGLRLDPHEVASERQVILEEIAMYQDDPWDALELAVQAELFAGHPYGRSVLGNAEELAAVDREALAEFHHRFYRPANAVMVVAGEVGEEALTAVKERFAGLDATQTERPPVPSWRAPGELRRVERRDRRLGEVARLLMAFPAPSVSEPDHAALRLLITLLGVGRASRLHRLLVDEEQLCLGVSLSLAESTEAGFLSVSAELLPGIEPLLVEERVLTELAGAEKLLGDLTALERGRRVLLADWVFQHERIHQQALTAGWALALFDLDFPRRHLAAALTAAPEELAAVARRWLPPRAGVVGWSLP